MVFGGTARAGLLATSMPCVMHGPEHCTVIPNATLVLAVCCALHYPMSQQVRMQRALLLTAVDMAVIATFGTPALGSWLLAAAVAVAAGAVGTAVTAVLEYRCRARFLKAQ